MNESYSDIKDDIVRVIGNTSPRLRVMSLFLAATELAMNDHESTIRHETRRLIPRRSISDKVVDGLRLLNNIK